MTCRSEADQPRFLRTSQAALYLNLSARTLEKHRSYGTGPIYHKVGGLVLYDPADLEAWARGGRQSSTSDAGAGAIRPAKRHAALAPAYRTGSRER